MYASIQGYTQRANVTPSTDIITVMKLSFFFILYDDFFFLTSETKKQEITSS